MTSVKRKRESELLALWRHARPHTKRVLKRYSAAGSSIVLEVLLSQIHGFPHLLGRLWILATLIFMAFACGAFFLGEMDWDAKERRERLSKILADPDLRHRFTGIRLAFGGDDAAQIEQVQEAIEFGAREAQRLAGELQKYESMSKTMQEKHERDQESVEALASLLDAQAERFAGLIERKGRRSQWLFLILGAVLGVAVQAFAQWIF